MTKKLIIELLEEKREPVFDESIELTNNKQASIDNSEAKATANIVVTRSFRWAWIDELGNWPTTAEIGSEDDLLMSLSNQPQSALLLVPGSKVVTKSMPFHKKEARHFAKLLPYQIEDDVIGSVDDLHFAIKREPKSSSAIIAYTNAAWLFDLLEWARNHDIVVETCLANFQLIQDN